MRLIQLIILLTVISCSSPSNKEAVENIDPIEFLRFVLTDTNDLNLVVEGCNIISDISILPPPNMPDGSFSDFLANILAETDTLFIIDQLRQSNNFRVDKLEEYGFKILKISEIQTNTGVDWDSIYENNEQGILSVSRPIFNKSYNKVYVRVGYFCGLLCGSGLEVVLEKIANKWILKKATGTWIS